MIILTQICLAMNLIKMNLMTDLLKAKTVF